MLYRIIRISSLLTFVILMGVLSLRSAPPIIEGCTIFPTDNIWNTPIDTLPVDPYSDAYINTIGATKSLKGDFGSGIWPPSTGGPIGIPFITVSGSQPKVNVTFDYDDESDPGPYPVPANAPIEGGPNAGGDRHVLVIDRDNCTLYELYSAYPQGDGSWSAGSGAIYDLNSNAMRPDGWTSADAAGLPILPGLVRYDEVASGEITHALRFTVPQTRNTYVWPARHYASNLTGVQYPPMGQYFRLKASYDISGFSPEMQVILRALKTYGMILADNGSSWYMSGVPDERWNNSMIHELGQVKGSDFEAVDVSSLMVDPNSARVSTGPSPDSPTGLAVELPAVPPIIPTFRWDHNANAGQYRVWVQSTAGKIVDQTFPSAQICTADGCSVAPNQIPSFGLLEGTYRWWVYAIIASNNMPRSEEQQFVVDVPSASTPSGFLVDTEVFPPVFSWDDDANTLYYQVYIGSQAAGMLHWNWYEKAAICEADRCSLEPFIGLTEGTNYLYVMGWGPGGISTGGIQGWEGITFDLTPPALVTNMAVTNHNTGSPTFSWAHSEGALYYQFWMGTLNPVDTRHTNWYAAADLGCADDDICSLPDISLANGNYGWYVQAWGHGGITSAGILGWATGNEFTVSQ